MVVKKELKEKLERLLKDYQSYSVDEREGMNEDDTRAKFIDPLLKGVLEWDEHDIDRQKSIESLTPEGHMKRADYSYPKIPKIIVEAKKLNVPIDNGDFDNQVIDYAYSKAVNWAVLTNFKSFRVWYVTRKKKNMFCRLNIAEDNIEQTVEELFYFLRENIFNGVLDKKAEVRGIKLQEIDITADLTESLNISRQKINNYLKKEYEKKYKEEEREELTQGIINRLIFIKKVEAESLEENKLEQVVRKERTNISDKVVEIFTYYRKKYDSDVFGLPDEKAEVEKLNIEDKFTLELLKAISNPVDSERAYNFAAMDVDVLGSIYENYLAYIQRGIKLVGGKEKRKGQGIYYTPRYIVNFITKNTVEKILNNKGLSKVKEVKILDPACGSGSFLVSAIENLDQYYRVHYKNWAELSRDEKLKLIKNNIFGVDLDERAVSIAKLNIYLQVLTQRGQADIRAHHTLLPELKENVKLGNSLIVEEKIAGEAFDWRKEFKDTMGGGGFDVIIGNPPYVRVDSLKEEEKSYWKEKFETATGKYDIYYLFVELSLELLKEEGLFGFIIPNKFCAASSAKVLRDKLINNTKSLSIVSVSSMGVFRDAANYPVILLFRKGKGLKEIEIGNATDQLMLLGNGFQRYSINKKDMDLLPHKVFPINTGQKEIDLVIRLLRENEKFGKYINISEGLRIPEKYERDDEKIKILKQFQFEKWSGIRKAGTISESNLKKVISEKSDRYINLLKDKIVIAEDALSITATLDNQKMVPQGGVYFGTLINDDGSLKYILGLLNSKLLSFVYKVLFGGMHMGGGYLRYRTEFLDELPIKKMGGKQLEEMIGLVEKILLLNERLSEGGGKNTGQYARIKEQNGMVEKEINELVYNIYGITKEERKIIEDS